MPYTYQDQVEGEARSIYDIPASSGDVITADYERGLEENPLTALSRMATLDLSLDPNIARSSAKKKVLDKTTADQRLQEMGLGGQIKVDDSGITEAGLTELMSRKQVEMKRQELYQRAQGGFAENMGRLGVGLFAMAHDPTNIALGFIPVVGEARYAGLLAEAGGVAGRTAIRASVGAAEGAVGQAIVEPFIYASRNYEQADYTIADSLLNVFQGGVFGAALHTTAGGVGDVKRLITGDEAPWRAEVLQNQINKVTPNDRITTDDAQLILNMRQELAKGVDDATVMQAISTWSPEAIRAIKPELPASIRGAIEPMRMSDLAQPTQDAILRNSIAQALEGRPVDIEGILKTEIGTTPDGRSTLDLVPERFQPETVAGKTDELLASISKREADIGQPTTTAASRELDRLGRQREAVEMLRRSEPLTPDHIESIRHAAVQLATDQGVVVPYRALDGSLGSTLARADNIRQSATLSAFQSQLRRDQTALTVVPEEARLSSERAAEMVEKNRHHSPVEDEGEELVRDAKEAEALAAAELKVTADRMGEEPTSPELIEIDEAVARSERWARTAELATSCLTMGIS